MNRRGFTLVELLAVIAILAILSIIAVPNVLKYLNESRIKAMVTQENNISDAANLFVTDYCSSSKIHDGMCPASYENNEEGKKYLCLSSLNLDTVKYKNKECKGIIVYYDEYSKGKTYLYCGEDKNYEYITDVDLDLSLYPDCGIS